MIQSRFASFLSFFPLAHMPNTQAGLPHDMQLVKKFLLKDIFLAEVGGRTRTSPACGALGNP